jgi:hypothetical protein
VPGPKWMLKHFWMDNNVERALANSGWVSLIWKSKMLWNLKLLSGMMLKKFQNKEYFRFWARNAWSVKFMQILQNSKN